MTTTGLTRKRAFWIVYAVVAALSLAVAWQLFPLAIPLVNLDIRLARHDAITKAETLAATLKLEPTDARTAARFAHDQAAQNYIELEGGGKPAFAALVAGDVYAPYWWEVRLFRPGEVTETLIRFRPDGSPYGFAQRMPERFVPADPAGLALDRDVARRLAEERAHVHWGIDFGTFELLEQAQQTRPTGRVDQTFVYERTARTIGEARFRLRLTVTGDALTEVTHYVHVPESFDRRFQALRSANNTLADVAGLAAGALYGLCGCLLGTAWLLRKRALLWRPAVVAGFVVGALMGAMAFANAPAAWFDFDTAQSTTTFWLRQIGGAALLALAGGLGYGLVFMAAEGLSRRAFPDHPQLWRVWSRDAAPTHAMLGRTLGGYFFVPLELAMIAAFYYATNRWFGWWQPSESLTDPNILGSAVPALAPIAISLQAGFMEECLFRAIPLSLAALIGARYGRRGIAVGIAIVVQALVFGGAHANYPGFPSYSRLVELIVPSVLWALIFLRFGLVPTILLHALFDLALFSIPLFLVDAPGSDLQRGLVVVAALVPLGIIIARRIGAGAWGELATGLRNGAWEPTAGAPAVSPAGRSEAGTALPGWIARFQRALPVLGFAGLAAWVLATPFRADAPSLTISRSAAEAAADAALAARGVTLGPEWRRDSVVRLASGEPAQWQGHKFVWREAGREAYAGLVGTTLAPPLWDVRYARFDGEVDDRVEEWRVTIDGGGSVRQVRHTLPEGRAGAKLAGDEARTLARRAVRERYHLDPEALKEIGAEEKQRPARTDWTFLFSEPRVAVGADGEARLAVTVAGDEIAAYGRYVHVPEAWQRTERERDGRLAIVRMAFVALIAIAGLAAVIMGVIDWTHGRRDRRALFGVAAITFGLGAVGIANGWPLMAITFKTAEPFVSQAAIAVSGALVATLLIALVLGLAAGVGAWAAGRPQPHALAGRTPVWIAGICAGLFTAGVGAVLERIVPATAPLWPTYGTESAVLPPLGAALVGARLLPVIGIGLFVLFGLERLTADWRRLGWLAVLLLIAITTATSLAAAPDPRAAAGAGVVTGIAVAAVVYGLLRFDYRAVPPFLAIGVVLPFAENALWKGTPAALANAAIAIAVAALVTWGAMRYIERVRADVTGNPAPNPVAQG